MLLKTNRLFIAVSVSCAGLCASLASAADLLSIRTLAPEKSILVLGADDLDATKTRFEKTPLAAWWKSPEVQKASQKFRDEIDKSFGELTTELGISRDDITCPSSLGAALFLELNEATGTEDPAFIVFVDWGKEAERFGKVYDAAIAKVEKDKPMPFTVEDMKGRRVYVFHEDKPVAAKDKQGGMEEDEGPLASMKLCVTRDGGRLLVSGGTTAMGDMLAKIDGDKGKTVADNDDFKGSLETVGGAPDVYATLLTEKAFAFISRIEPGAAFMLGAGMGIIPSVIGDIRGWSLGIALDTPTAPLTQSIGAYIPGSKVGLLSLLASAPAEKAPDVVPADAISYGRFNLKFNEIPRVLEDIIAKLPEGMSDQAKATIEPYLPKMKESFGAMGSTLHLWSSASANAGEPAPNVAAVPVTDAKQAQSLISLVGEGAELKPRDFLGHTIYAGPDAEMPAIGFSSQFMFISTAAEVEKALRALGAKDNASITSDPAYQAAAATWAKEDLVGYGFTNTIAMVENVEKMGDALKEAQAMAQGGVDVKDLNMDAFDDALKPELLKQFFGPTVWQLRAMKSGFRTDFFVLPAAGAAPAAKK